MSLNNDSINYLCTDKNENTIEISSILNLNILSNVDPYGNPIKPNQKNIKRHKESSEQFKRIIQYYTDNDLYFGKHFSNIISSEELKKINIDYIIDILDHIYYNDINMYLNKHQLLTIIMAKRIDILSVLREYLYDITVFKNIDKLPDKLVYGPEYTGVRNYLKELEIW